MPVSGPSLRPVTGPQTRLAPVTARVIGDSDLSVYPVSLGANVFGWLVDDSAARRVLDVYADHGGQLIDTADSYAGGRSETIIGSWMAGRANRDRVVIATKIGKSADHPGLSAKAIAAAVDASLERLRTDYIDLLFLHVDDRSVPFEETLLAVDRLVRAGKVRWMGASNHLGNRLVEARVACGLLGVSPIVALQNQYNLMRRAEYERDLAPVADAQQLGVMPRFALAAGFLSGKYRTRAEIMRSPRARELSPYLARRGMRVLGALESVADAQGVSMATVAIAWLLTRPNVVAPIVSTTTPQQVLELLAAPAISLTRQQVQLLDEVSA